MSEPPLLVYFSSVSENTHRFVQKVQAAYPELEILRLPLKASEASEVRVERPYVLTFPTYGGSVEGKHVPLQIIRLLNVENNRDKCVGVIGLGNRSFGETFCAGAYIAANKVNVPVLMVVEVAGTPDDIDKAVMCLRGI